jgi:pilus assembly protein CpaE
MPTQITIVGATDRRLEDLVRASGLRPSLASATDLRRLAHPGASQPDLLIVDMRGQTDLPPALAILKRQHPATSVMLVMSELHPAVILEAMRAGVNECIAEPLTPETVAAAITGIVAQRSSPAAGEVFAFVGAKGGVGTTTLAVNVATALSQIEPGTLLIDMHPSYGDAAVLLGCDPRYSVIDALENTHRLDASFFNGLTAQSESGLTLLASSDHPPSAPVDVHRIELLLDFAVRNFRYTVLDLPRSNPAILDALQIVSNIFVVTTQELASVRGASRLTAPLSRRYGRDKVDILVNRFDGEAGLGQSDIEEAVNTPLRFTFGSDYRAALRALNQGRPLVLDRAGKLAESLIAFTRQVSGQVPADAVLDKGGLALKSRFASLRWLASS